jgi:membrane protein, antimicrobial resistance system
MSAFADVFRVLFDPAPVFERVREKPRFLAPYLVLAAVQIVLGLVNLPFLKAGITASMAGRDLPPGGPDPANFAFIGVVVVPIFLVVIFLLSALILWVLVSIFGGEGKFVTLLSVTTYASVPAVILLAIIGSIVLRLKGVEAMTSPQDLQPALGLDLLAPSVTGFMGAVLKAINPFSIWGLVLTAVGVSVTHNLPRSTGYTIATISFVISVLLAGVFAGLGAMGGS